MARTDDDKIGNLAEWTFKTAEREAQSGNFKSAQKLYKTSATRFLEAVQNFNAHQCYKMAAWAEIQAGRMAVTEGELDSAVTSYRHAASHYRKSGDEVGASAALNNEGDIYRSQNQLKKALECYQEAIAIIDKGPYGRGHSIAHYNAGATECIRRNFTSAGRFFGKGKKTAAAGGDAYWVSRFDESLRALTENGLFALEGADTEGDGTSYANIYTRIGAVSIESVRRSYPELL